MTSHLQFSEACEKPNNYWNISILSIFSKKSIIRFPNFSNNSIFLNNSIVSKTSIVSITSIVSNTSTVSNTSIVLEYLAYFDYLKKYSNIRIFRIVLLFQCLFHLLYFIQNRSHYYLSINFLPMFIIVSSKHP